MGVDARSTSLGSNFELEAFETVRRWIIGRYRDTLIETANVQTTQRANAANQSTPKCEVGSANGSCPAGDIRVRGNPAPAGRHGVAQGGADRRNPGISEQRRSEPGTSRVALTLGAVFELPD